MVSAHQPKTKSTLFPTQGPCAKLNSTSIFIFIFIFSGTATTHRPPQMPRLTPELIRVAGRRHALLPLLLPECRTIEQASMELRWLTNEGRREGGGKNWLKALCEKRGRGWPLQYLLGTQPFGALEMICERGVLIPRFVSC